MEIYEQSIEEYYRKNYPEYKIIKIGNFLFVKMGKLITFHFDEKNNYIPKYSIGPQWYLTLLLLIIIISLVYLVYSTIFINLSFIEKLIFFLFVAIEYFLVFKTALIHNKIAMNKNILIENKGYCSICKVSFDPKNKVKHCGFCGVCVEQMDHHCVWVGKCIAKNNLYYFYAMVGNVFILYIYIIICGVLMGIRK